jgi:hypothetical protein
LPFGAVKGPLSDLLGLRLPLPLQSRPAQLSDGTLYSTELLDLGLGNIAIASCRPTWPRPDPRPPNPDPYPLSPHIAGDFVARAVEVRKVLASRAKSVLEVWGRIVLKYIRVRTSRIDPKIPCLRRSQPKASCNMRARPLRLAGVGLHSFFSTRSLRSFLILLAFHSEIKNG